MCECVMLVVMLDVSSVLCFVSFLLLEGEHVLV